jgi:hypothetical protein
MEVKKDRDLTTFVRSTHERHRKKRREKEKTVYRGLVVVGLIWVKAASTDFRVVRK